MTTEIRIDALPTTVLPTSQHVFAAMKDNQTYQISIQQVINLVKAAIVDGAPEALDTLNELAAALSDDANYAATVTAAIAAVQTQVVPVGTTVLLRGTTAPTGFIKENGAVLSRTTYSSLWTFAQTSGNLAITEGSKDKGQFGPGDGSTTFSIPDSRGLTFRGWDDGAGVDTGRIFGSYQADALQKISYYTERPMWNGGRGSGLLAGFGGGSFRYGREYSQAITHPDDTTAGAPRQAVETRMKNVAVLACLKY